MLFRIATAPAIAAITLAAPFQSLYWQLRARPHRRKAIEQFTKAIAEPDNPQWLVEGERHLRMSKELERRAWLYRTSKGASR